MFRFPKGSTTSEDYNGAREEEGFYDFIGQKTGTQITFWNLATKNLFYAGIKVVAKKPITAVKVLSSSTFEEDVLKSGKNTLVEFYAPWVTFLHSQMHHFSYLLEILLVWTLQKFGSHL